MLTPPLTYLCAPPTPLRRRGTNYDVSDPANPLLCGLNLLNPSSVNLPTTFAPTPNYPSNDPASLNPVSNTYLADPRRESRCASDPNGFQCKTTGTLCTAQAEIIAHYDEGNIQPSFQLNQDIPYTDPNAGINLTFMGSPPYSSDSFKCTEIDPGTGFPVERSLNVFIGCDSKVAGLNVVDYTERGQCQYYITANSSAACGTRVATPTPPPPGGDPNALPCPCSRRSRARHGRVRICRRGHCVWLHLPHLWRHHCACLVHPRGLLGRGLEGHGGNWEGRGGEDPPVFL